MAALVQRASKALITLATRPGAAISAASTKAPAWIAMMPFGAPATRSDSRLTTAVANTSNGTAYAGSRIESFPFG